MSEKGTSTSMTEMRVAGRQHGRVPGWYDSKTDTVSNQSVKLRQSIAPFNDPLPASPTPMPRHFSSGATSDDICVTSCFYSCHYSLLACFWSFPRSGSIPWKGEQVRLESNGSRDHSFYFVLAHPQRHSRLLRPLCDSCPRRAQGRLRSEIAGSPVDFKVSLRDGCIMLRNQVGRLHSCSVVQAISSAGDSVPELDGSTRTTP